ncbi:hypothetical protein [Streptomyces sp. T028]|uniref:SbtR family transcriptional regulator n=1 Tax=Streptomyces sp. T028 TaxID=3394379 RepID=UPI003A8751B8
MEGMGGVLSRAADVPLSVIARRAGVGRGTLDRQVGQLADRAARLLNECGPGRALHAWMDDLAQYAMTNSGLSDALREAARATGGPERSGYSVIAEAITRLLDANHGVGALRPGVTADDFVPACEPVRPAGCDRVAPPGVPGPLLCRPWVSRRTLDTRLTHCCNI